MDENKEKKWSEISEEIADVSQNIKNKIEEEDVIDAVSYTHLTLPTTPYV